MASLPSNGIIPSVESYLALCCILLGCFRLFLWPPYADSWFHIDRSFLPGALLTCAGVFFGTCLFGNIGRPVCRYQPQIHRGIWLLVLAMPAIGLIATLLWPAKWLFFAAGATVVISAGQLVTGQWAAAHGSEDIGHLFRRYAYTGLALAAGLAVLQILLDRIGESNPASAAGLAFMVSILLSAGLLRFAITWWNGRNQRNILAQIDSDIVIRRSFGEARIIPDEEVA